MCPNCQAPTRPGEDFCTSCGTALRRDDSAAQQPQGQYPSAGQPFGQQPPTRVIGQPGPGGQQPPPPYPPPQQQWPQQQWPQQPPSGGPPAPGWQGQVQRTSTPFRFDLKRLGQADRIIGGATIVMLISLLLPWYGYLGATEDGLKAHGYLVISLVIALALIVYLVLRAGWDALPFRLPIAHAPLLLIGTGVQFLFVLIAFLFKPFSFLSWEIGAYLALVAAAVACGVIAVPAIRSLQARQP